MNQLNFDPDSRPITSLSHIGKKLGTSEDLRFIYFNYGRKRRNFDRHVLSSFFIISILCKWGTRGSGDFAYFNPTRLSSWLSICVTSELGLEFYLGGGAAAYYYFQWAVLCGATKSNSVILGILFICPYVHPLSINSILFISIPSIPDILFIIHLSWHRMVQSTFGTELDVGVALRRKWRVFHRFRPSIKPDHTVN